MPLRALWKGWLGETAGALAHRVLLDNRVYHSLNDVTLSSTEGTTQIDHVLVSRFGIFVIESKNLNGWIFGSEHDAQWTQNLYGKKIRFQNPLRQNYRHIAALATFLKLPHEKFHSLVMFWGDCTFKTSLPDNVLNRGYPRFIQSKTEVLFIEEEVVQIIEAIQTGRLPRNWKTRQDHVASLRERHAPKTVCPKCGGNLVLRIAKVGHKAGETFWGCANFPRCRYTQAEPPVL
jgi:restriction system protein